MLVFSDFLEDKVTHKGKVKASSHNRDLLNFLRNLFSLTGYKFLESFPSLRPPEAGFRYGSQISLLSGARGGNRTRTPLLEQDFKSCASTNSATRAKINTHTQKTSLVHSSIFTEENQPKSFISPLGWQIAKTAFFAYRQQLLILQAQKLDFLYLQNH